MDDLKKQEIIKLRTQGFSYSEISFKVGKAIPKSTLAYACKGVILSNKQKNRIRNKINASLVVARQKSALLAKVKRTEREYKLLQKNRFLGKIIQRVDVAKIALAMLFLGEGSKTHTATVMFGNSNPVIIALFLRFLRKCYSLDESKFRCTVQCRADQNIEELKKFWAMITKIPLKQFYKIQIDPRTIGKPLKNADYKGVCRIDYLSAELVADLHQTIKIITLAGL